MNSLEIFDKNIFILRVFKKNISVKEIINKLDLPCIIAFVDKNVVICKKQILNAIYYFFEHYEDYKQRWIKDDGLRLLALLIGERQVKDAIKIGNPEAEDSILIAICSKKIQKEELFKKLREIGVSVSEETSMDKKGETLDDSCLDALEKQAELIIEVERET